MNATEIEVGMKLNLTLYGNIDGRSHFEGEVAGIKSGQFVPSIYNTDVNHANIYPNLPDDIKVAYQDDSTTYKYIELYLVDESTIYIGLPWIIESTITEVVKAGLNVHLTNFDVNRKTELTKLLAQHNFQVDSMVDTLN